MADQPDQLIMKLGPWGGLDASTASASIAPEQAAALLNVVPNRTYGALTPVYGRLFVSSGGNQAHLIDSLGKLSHTYDSEYHILSAYSNAGALGFAYMVSPFPNTTGWVDVTTSKPPYNYYGQTIIPSLPYTPGIPFGEMINFNEYLYYANQDPNMLGTYKWDGTTLTKWGITQPILFALYYTVSAGLISAHHVKYIFTYEDADGNESSQSEFYDMAGTFPFGPQTFVNPTLSLLRFKPWSGSALMVPGLPLITQDGSIGHNGVYSSMLAILDTQTLVDVQIALDFPISSDPKVSKINVYRISDEVPSYLRVGSVANVSGTGGALSGYARFVDNVPNNILAGPTLLTNNDCPAPFYTIFQYKGSIFGFGYPAYNRFANNYQTGMTPVTAAPAAAFPPSSFSVEFNIPGSTSELWYTYTNEDSFDSVTRVVPVGVNDPTDIPMGGGAVGGVLLLIKSKTIWIMYGEPDNFNPPIQISTVGCTSKASISFDEQGIARWMTNVGVAQFDGSSLQIITSKYGHNSLEKMFSYLQPIDKKTVTSFSTRGFYWLYFNTFNPFNINPSDNQFAMFNTPPRNVLFGLHLDTQTWWVVHYPTELPSALPIYKSYPVFISDYTEQMADGSDFVFSSWGSNLIQWFAHVFKDLSNSYSSLYRSKRWTPDVFSVWDLTRLRIRANKLGTKGISELNINIVPGTNYSVYSDSDNYHDISIKLKSVHVNSVQLIIGIGPVLIDFEIISIELFGNPIRENNQSDNSNLISIVYVGP